MFLIKKLYAFENITCHLHGSTTENTSHNPLLVIFVWCLAYWVGVAECIEEGDPRGCPTNLRCHYDCSSSNVQFKFMQGRWCPGGCIDGSVHTSGGAGRWVP